jgi:hypothetical protein
MDGLSGAASVIAVIDISAKIASICFQYFKAVKDTKDDIEREQRKADNITRSKEKSKSPPTARTRRVSLLLRVCSTHLDNTLEG